MVLKTLSHPTVHNAYGPMREGEKPNPVGREEQVDEEEVDIRLMLKLKELKTENLSLNLMSTDNIGIDAYDEGKGDADNNVGTEVELDFRTRKP